MRNISLLLISPFFIVSFGTNWLKWDNPENECSTRAINFDKPTMNGFAECQSSLVNEDIWHVNGAATGGNSDGTSWQDAFTDLQDALAVAGVGDSIWVAKGTYRPTVTDDRTISFNIPKGTALLGGFAGDEAIAVQRNPSANETILSGDIGVENDIEDNSYHVLYALGSDSTTVIDGFTITRGNALIPNIFSAAERGGGLFVATDANQPVSCPVVSNCIFLKNRAREGGAIGAVSTDIVFANPVLRNCSFIGNFSTEHAGALYIKGGVSTMPQRHVLGCSFAGNRANGGFGGGIYITDIDNTLLIDSCFFEKDTAQLSGGAVCHEAITRYGNVFFNECTFQENVGQSGGGFLHFFSMYPTDSTKYCHFVFNNCLFYKNKVKNDRGGAIETVDFNSSSKTEVYNSVFRENQAINGGAGIHVYNYCFENGLGFCDNELIVEGCRFEGNNSVLTGAANGIFYGGDGNEGARNKSRIVNNTFFGNEGAIAMLSGNLGGVDALVANCTFYKNGNWPIIKNWEAGFDSSFYNNMTITNCVIWENTPIYRLFYNNSPDYTIHDYNIHHSIVNVPDCVVAGVDGCNEGMLYQSYPMFFDTLNGDLRVAACSPAINAGENQTVQDLSINNDIAGSQRIINDTVDMGAYERLISSLEVANIQDANCEGSANGSVEFEVSGDEPIIYSWENSSNTGNGVENLNPGNYLFTVMDNFDCSDTIAIEIGSSTNIEVQYTITNASTMDASDGAIIIDSTFGGNEPYSYQWGDGGVGSFRNNLPIGNYQVTIIDADSCSTIQNFEIMAPSYASDNKSLRCSIRLFPNPVDDLLWVETQPILKQAKFTIYMPTAQSILSEPLTNNRTTISLIGLLPGLYFWEVRDKGLIVETGKFVKK